MGKQNKINLKASIAGLTKIKQRRKEKGWNLNDERWLQSASEVLGVSHSGNLAPGISYGTWKRFLGGKKPINQKAFQAYCRVLDLDWQQVIDSSFNLTDERQDWGEATDVSIFFGRTAELASLKNWAIKDRCSLILLLGMGGIGKTTLATKLARLIESEFDFIIWRSLRNTPLLSDFLADLIQLISRRQEANLPESNDRKLNLLLKYLTDFRCLIVIDNVESIYINKETNNDSSELENREYSSLFGLVGTSNHQSCLLLTSREKPPEIASLETNNPQVRCQQLSGLDIPEAKSILAIKGYFRGAENDWQTLVRLYGGNPLALKIIAATIQDFFEGNIAEFLKLLEQEYFICDDLYLLLQQQFDRLDLLAKQIMYWLAIAREPTSLTQLQSDLIEGKTREELTLALTDLKNRSLIETIGNKYTQQPAVMEYAIAEFTELIATEILRGEIGLLNTHAIVKAQVPEYIRDTQTRSILQPAIDKLISVYGSPEELARCLSRLVRQCRQMSLAGYLSGNVIHILRYLDLDLTGYDFSGLTIWQANLQNLNLHRVNFSNCDLSRSIFTEALGNVLAVAFSEQGDVLATANNDGKIRLWHRQTGKIQSILAGHTNWVRCVAFASGEKIVSGSGDRTIKLWNWTTGKCLQTLKGHNNEVYSVAFSPDGKLIASGSSDRTIKLWNVPTGECLKTLERHHNCPRSVVFSPDGKLIASGSSDRTIKLWYVQTGSCLQTLTGHDNCVYSVAFSPDGKLIASGSSDRTIKLWNVGTGKCLKTYSEHTAAVYAVAFSPDGQTLASGSSDRTVRLWNWQTDRCFRVLYGHENQIISLDFSADSQTLACASLDRTVKLWDIETGKCLHTLQGYTDWAFPLAFAPQIKGQSPILAGVNNNYTVGLWNTDTAECQQVFAGHQDRIWSLAYNATGTKIASCGAEPSIRVWDVASGACDKILVGHTDWVRSVSFHPNEKILASSSADGTIRLWDLASGKAAIIKTPQVWSIAFNVPGNLLATGSIQGELKIWDVTTLACHQTYTAPSKTGIYSVAFNPHNIADRDIVATGHEDGCLRLWDLTTRNSRIIGKHEEFIAAIAFNPRDRIIASGSCDRTVRLWNFDTGNCLHVLTEKENKFCAVAFSPDGKIVAAGSQNECITLWHGKSGEFIKVIRPPRLYEGMNITNAKGLTPAQQETLKVLGAVEMRSL